MADGSMKSVVLDCCHVANIDYTTVEVSRGCCHVASRSGCSVILDNVTYIGRMIDIVLRILCVGQMVSRFIFYSR